MRIEEIFIGKKSKCKYCGKIIKTGDLTIISWWINKYGSKSYTRYCNEECADEFWDYCLTRKSGVC